MIEGIITGSLSKEIQSLIAENSSPANLLPINAVFPELYSRDGETGAATIHLNISCDKNQVMPSSMLLIIRTPRKEIFHGDILLSNYVSGRFSGREMMQAEVTLSEMDFAQIENDLDAEVTFSCGGRESTFLIYI